MKLISKIFFILFLFLNISLFSQTNNNYKLKKQRRLERRKERKGRNRAKSHLMYKDLEKKIFDDLKAENPEIALYLKKYPRSKARMQIIRQFFKKSGKLLLEGKEEEAYTDLLAMLKLNIEIEMNTKKYYSADIIDKSKIKKILENKISLLFDLREKMRYKIIEDLEKKLKIEKEKYDLRQKNKSGIVEKRLEKFIGRQDDLNW